MKPNAEIWRTCVLPGTQKLIHPALKLLKTAQKPHAESFTNILSVQKEETHASCFETRQDRNET